MTTRRKALSTAFTTALALTAMACAATAGPLPTPTASVYGHTTETGFTYADPGYAADGSFPAEGSHWQTNTMWWQSPSSSSYDTLMLQFDFGQLYTIEDIVVSVDNNDNYTFEYVDEHGHWKSLFEIDATYGDIDNGMDTMSTINTDSEYVSQIDFSPITARYLYIWDSGGDNKYSVGELQAYGSPAPTPEPGTILLLGTGLAGLAGSRLRRRRF